VHLETLCTNGFRALEDREISIPRAGLRLIGPNGSGKSTLLEAIGYLSTGRSHRGASDHQIVCVGRRSFSVAGRLVESDVLSSDLSVSWSRGTKRVKVDAQVLPRLSELIGRLATVVVDSDSVQIVRSGPHRRRTFLDLSLSTLSPAYLKCLLDYRVVMRRRNLSLTSAPAAELEVWSTQLAQLCGTIVAQRGAFLERLEVEAQRLHERLSPSSPSMALRYRPSLSSANPLEALSALQDNLDRDRRLGYTTIGPHRDDIDILLGKHPARSYASLGECKSLALALLAAQAHLLSASLAQPPVLLLDDLWGELDPQHVARLDLLFPHDAQAIVTDTGTADLPGAYTLLEALALPPRPPA